MRVDAMIAAAATSCGAPLATGGTKLFPVDFHPPISRILKIQ